jgi:hypothetical protein
LSLCDQFTQPKLLAPSRQIKVIKRLAMKAEIIRHNRFEPAQRFFSVKETHSNHI